MELFCSECGQPLPLPSGLVIDHARGEVRFRGKGVMATPKQFAVMAILAAAPGRPVSREGLFTSLYWGAKGRGVGIKNIDGFICKLRKIITPLGLDIVTHWGRGYELTIPGQTPWRDQAAAPTDGAN